MAGNKTHKPDLIPSLREATAAFKDADPWIFNVPIPVQGNIPFLQEPVNEVPIFFEDEQVMWTAPKISELFRGKEQPPDFDLNPVTYTRLFYFIEKHICQYSLNFTPPSDQNLESYYSNLARRPDGRITEPVQALIWRASALLLAIYPLSQAEFEGMMRKLSRNCTALGQRPISRNYAAYLKTLFVPVG